MQPDDAPSEAGATPSPSTLRYAVILCDDEWRVASGRASFGRFPTRAGALAVAVNLTRQALEAGHEAELLAQDEGGDYVLRALFPPAQPR